MHYPRIVDDVAAAATLAGLAWAVILGSKWHTDGARISAEQQRRASLSQHEREQEDFEDWADKNAW